MAKRTDKLKQDPWETKSLTTSIQDVFRSSAFSDLTIICDNREFKVHKVIISMQSGYFARMFRHDWKEVQEGVIRLQEDDPSAIEAMLHFMYGYQYDRPDVIKSPESAMLLHVKVYQAGDKYGIPRLKDKAMKKFATSTMEFWETDGFTIAVAEVYSTTPPGDRGLRDTAVAVSIEHLQALQEKQSFQEVLRETPGFAADIILSPSSELGNKELGMLELLG
ncbi:hypothetical protein N8T08_005633 [Aspergillus melleus]|uniref:Uncharacterized protein n=1 Tax=Aspergillus melleus TaxID=138277 RepID=A0ACC3B1K1_9EURO|nr:hypothetical protein N8T08_005633 [Aspergillus melleus]